MRMTKILLATLFSIAIASCGGGGGGATPSASTTTVTGTVATGKPLANAQITLTDSNGVSRTATSSATGSYTIDVTGLTAPFVVKATGLQGALSVTLVSLNSSIVISSANTINLTQLTTAIAAMLSSTGFAKDLDAVNDKAKIIASLTTVDNYIKTLIAPTLTAAGLSTTADPITTPFVADGTGYDSIYDNLLIGQASNGTIFMAPERPTSPCALGSSSSGGCWTASDPGDQTITNPNLCGSDIATGAGIPCDPSQPITAPPSVALPIIGPSDVAGGFAISGSGLHFGPTDTPPPATPLNLTTVTACTPGTSGCLISLGSGPFSGGATYTNGTLSGTCTFSLAVSGSYSVQVTTQSNGSYAGSATVTGNFASTRVSSTGTINCIATSTGWSTSSQISGTMPSITWTTSFVTPGGHTVNGTFSGTISGSSITGVSSVWN